MHYWVHVYQYAVERYIIDYVLEIQEKRFELKNLKFEMQADTHEEGQQFISISTCIIDDFVFIFFQNKARFLWYPQL